MQNIIAAISTPPGKGGVAIIRVSGEGAHELTSRIFRPASGRSLLDYPTRYAVYGYILHRGERIDDGIVTLFEKGASYTGEPVAEISCHGGMLISRTVLEAVLAAGATLAGAGEFTRRAFINGRLTLTEAEAIGLLIEAKSEEQIRLTAAPARDRLKKEIEGIRASLTALLGSIYARIDYPDEDLGDFSDEETISELTRVRADVSRLISTYRTGRAIAEGISAVICGKPNVGKSTLYNLISGEDAAIVTDIPGTTRDVLERSLPLGRVMLRLSDTAGIREGAGDDPVEKIGIEKSREKISSAELILALFDLSKPLDSDDRDIIEEIRGAGGAKICILTKADRESVLDLTELPDIFDATLKISAKEEECEALSTLSDAINRLFTDEKISTSTDAVVASARQHSALLRAEELIDTAILAYSAGLPQDAASSDIELALGAIAEIDGRAVAESVTDDIFSRFCVGK